MQKQAAAGADTSAQAKAFAQFLSDLNKCPVFVVALVQGPVFGGGLGLLGCCDHVVVLKSEKPLFFTFSEVRLGMIPATISPYVMRKLGYSRTRSLFQTGQKFPTKCAIAWGLCHEEFTKSNNPEEFKVEFLKKSVLPCAPYAVQRSKLLVETVREMESGGEAMDGRILEYTWPRSGGPGG